VRQEGAAVQAGREWKATCDTTPPSIDVRPSDAAPVD
jgi:hypothetical protein